MNRSALVPGAQNLDASKIVIKPTLLPQKELPRDVLRGEIMHFSQVFPSKLNTRFFILLAFFGSVQKCKSSGWSFLLYVPCEIQNLFLLATHFERLKFIWLAVRKENRTSQKTEKSTSCGAFGPSRKLRFELLQKHYKTQWFHPKRILRCFPGCEIFNFSTVFNGFLTSWRTFKSALKNALRLAKYCDLWNVNFRQVFTLFLNG